MHFPLCYGAMYYAVTVISACIAVYTAFTAFIHHRKKSGKVCDNCKFYLEENGEEPLCGASFSLDPIPLDRTCFSFRWNEADKGR